MVHKNNKTKTKNTQSFNRNSGQRFVKNYSSLKGIDSEISESEKIKEEQKKFALKMMAEGLI